jgi:hypothetical protein
VQSTSASTRHSLAQAISGIDWPRIRLAARFTFASSTPVRSTRDRKTIAEHNMKTTHNITKLFVGALLSGSVALGGLGSPRVSRKPRRKDQG